MIPAGEIYEIVCIGEHPSTWVVCHVGKSVSQLETEVTEGRPGARPRLIPTPYVPWSRGASEIIETAFHLLTAEEYIYQRLCKSAEISFCRRESFEEFQEHVMDTVGTMFSAAVLGMLDTPEFKKFWEDLSHNESE
jgi:hypothetical protein